ncbi:hypothetical protein HF325_006918 [Metschnikowia pulcherrima]|uniref:Uncharacterized protein n=1 Tax=Metschnikowia pulcherrima TaxID=27326 RepID=A0A8H7L6P9_9ASCO|nr:hypothetical protein HF325_006918 [Metschnikowia pulcherrima]
MLAHGIKNEQNVQDSPFRAHKNFMLQQRVLEAVIKCWKGEHGETIFAIVELAENMESQMPSSLRNLIERPTQLLYHLYLGFPETGECIISHWKDKRKWRDIFLPETVLIFAREVWPMLPVSAKPRFNPDMVMDALLKIRFDAMVMELGHEDDFYDVSTYQNSRKVAAGIKRGTKAAFRPNDYRGQNVSDIFFYRVLKQLAEHPEVCPNCLSQHKLLACDEILENPWENLAAYTQGNFKEATYKNRNSRQLGYWRWITASLRK